MYNCASARNLGFIIYSSLSFVKPISMLSSTCRYLTRDLCRIRPTLDFDADSAIAISLVHSRLDYCNSLYYALSSSLHHRLHFIQNALARAVSRAPHHVPITPTLQSLHRLKIDQRIQYKVISIT